MQTYRTPGVYFERQDAAPPLIAPLRTDIAGFVGIAERGPLNTPVKIESLTQFANVFGRKIAQGYLAYAVDGFFKNGGETCWVVRVASLEQSESPKITARLDIFDDLRTPVLRLIAGSPGAWGNDIVARWIIREDRIISLTLHFPDGTEQLVREPLDLALKKGQKKAPDETSSELNALPASLLTPLVRIELPPAGTVFESESDPESKMQTSIRALEARLAGGADALKDLKPQHFSGVDSEPNRPRGLAALEQIKEVSVIAIPDLMPKLPITAKQKPLPLDCERLDVVPPPQRIAEPEVEFPPSFGDDEIFLLQQAMINHCERLGYRVAILDSPDTLNSSDDPESLSAFLPEQAIKWGADLGQTSFAALYYPWIVVDDPLLLTGLARAVPPSGHLAGIYARSDRARGVHKPPANEVIEGAVDLRFSVNEILHGALNDNGVNALRSFAGRGIRVYGARTLDSEIRFVNVRRLLSMIEKAIDQSTQWTVFEPNDRLLRREIDRVARTFLQTLFRKGMLDGATPDEAFFVQCDDSINPPEQIDLGQVVCRIGVQPPYPAEFVVVVIGKTQDAIEVLQEQGAGQNG